MDIAALSLCLLFIVWLFVREKKLHPMPSPGCWLVFLWMSLISSKSVMLLVGMDEDADTAERIIEGNPIDSKILLALMLTGALLLYRKRKNWGRYLISNGWFLAFCVYCGLSILWSEFPFVSLKRWTRELGNVIMVLLVLSEGDPAEAMRAIFGRFVRFAVPLSLVLIYFIPSIGTYVTDEGTTALAGITSNKNGLGLISSLSALFLLWDLANPGSRDGVPPPLLDKVDSALLLLMAIWLIATANSSTALICLMMGVVLLMLMKVPLLRRQMRFLGFYSLLFGLLIFELYSNQENIAAISGSVGRDATLTGRTQLWADLLDEPINPLLGTGYQGFWLGSRLDAYWSKYVFRPHHAHNGYLEIYLNGGVVGLSLLLAAFAHGTFRLKRVLLQEDRFAMLLLTFLAVALFYNWTEALFSSPNLLWIMLVLSALYNPAPSEASPLFVGPRRESFPRK